MNKKLNYIKGTETFGGMEKNEENREPRLIWG